jgi:hypothetical protein
MTIETAIQSKLVAAVASKTPRVYQGAREQGSALPAVSWDWIPGGESFQDMTAGSVGLAEGTVQFDAYAETTKEAAAIRELIRLAFQNHINAKMGGTSGVQVWACIFSGMSGGYEPETNVIVRSINFDIHYQQAQS